MWPVLRKWNIFERDDFSARGEQIREELAAFLEELGTVKVPRFEEQRDRSLAREANTSGIQAERLVTLEQRPIGNETKLLPEEDQVPIPRRIHWYTSGLACPQQDRQPQLPDCAVCTDRLH